MVSIVLFPSKRKKAIISLIKRPRTILRPEMDSLLLGKNHATCTACTRLTFCVGASSTHRLYFAAAAVNAIPVCFGRSAAYALSGRGPALFPSFLAWAGSHLSYVGCIVNVILGKRV